MKKTQIFTVLTVIAMLFATSCNKVKKEEDKLTSSVWKMTSMMIDGAEWIDLFDECSNDDEYHFNDDGSYSQNEGATKCFEDDPDVVDEGTWEFNDDATQITITTDGVSETSDVDELTDSKFVISGTIDDGAGGTVSAKITFEAI